MGEPTLEQRFADAMGQLLGPNFPTQIGVAVSGGGDSMARKRRWWLMRPPCWATNTRS